ncbi:TraY domain-containing protein [Zunongwangia sp. H14]|uniref:TraY domain-containing protein n=1 Tax=Zunongwangia sp. H14 TaxID=3240792 RepID=UPI00356887DA
MKVETAFRLEKELIEELKEQAKRNKRSLNNYVELILSKVVEKEPNDKTLEALEEARNNKDLKPISDIDKFLDSI